MAGKRGPSDNNFMSARSDPSSSVDTAISDVLGAEQDALAQIADCESRADKMLQDARRAVRAMVRETRERIGRLHAGCAERTREIIEELEREAAAREQEEAPEDGEGELLQRIVRAVAEELTTRERPGGG